MTSTWHLIVRLLGLDLGPEKLDVEQVVLRAIVIFVFSLFLVRLGHKRMLARKSAFDTIFIVIVGAILARAINGSGPFLPTVVGAAVLVLLHRIFCYLSFRSEKFERLIKGRADILVQDGELVPEALRRRRISREDFSEDMHLRGHGSPAEIALARLERSGEISFVQGPKNR